MQRFKTVTYALMHLIVAMSVAFALTQSWAAALGIGLIEPLVQTAFYAVHERLWARLGRTRQAAATSSLTATARA